MGFTVKKEFSEAFNRCMQHWNVTGDELEFERQRVRVNYLEAERCYLDIAARLNGGASVNQPHNRA